MQGWGYVFRGTGVDGKRLILQCVEVDLLGLGQNSEIRVERFKARGRQVEKERKPKQCQPQKTWEGGGLRTASHGAAHPRAPLLPRSQLWEPPEAELGLCAAQGPGLQNRLVSVGWDNAL